MYCLIDSRPSLNFFSVSRAADWNLQEPQWTGRMRLVAKGNECTIKLEDKLSGELFAKCPIEAYPGIAVEAVTDSSRYFVLRIVGDNGKLIIENTFNLYNFLKIIFRQNGVYRFGLLGQVRQLRPQRRTSGSF